ncbi:hypothetical protein LGM85_12615 [Burkholderia multivorans]|uniref:hypothetical protein n=1 Tax=Burkholderia multivorans TaxID=87883 RepID=UPI00123C67A9|nr:hypothetical protein [Burkholderia multivorans]MCA8484779.1 hypothetical protein [Burkholderia multivorans]QET29531.1 hypothetical protein FOB31_06790 [Burkholderia multivorans]QET39899.1 hypothetical protein FOB30_19590 [Burkholderia multivorans]
MSATYAFSCGNTGNTGNRPASKGVALLPATLESGNSGNMQSTLPHRFVAAVATRCHARQRAKPLPDKGVAGVAAVATQNTWGRVALHKVVPCVPSVPLDLGDSHAC